MKKFENPIEVLKTRINAHIQNGGSIYQPKRELPYYDYLNQLCHRLSKIDGVEYTTKDIYAKCGFNFNRDYYEFVQVSNDLFEITTNQFVDANFKALKPQSYSQCCIEASKHNSCLYDYLVIMAGVRLKDANINLDYELATKSLLKKAYPDGDTTGIKRDYPYIYEMLNHICEYKYPELSATELLSIYGYFNRRSKSLSKEQPNEEDILSYLNNTFKDKKINQPLLSKDAKMYHSIIALSINNEQSARQWLEAHGFEYLQGNMLCRLSQMKVREKNRYEFLKRKKKEFYKKYDLSTLSDEEKYTLNLQLLDSIAKIDNVKDFIDLPEYDIHEKDAD